MISTDLTDPAYFRIWRDIQLLVFTRIHKVHEQVDRYTLHFSSGVGSHARFGVKYIYIRQV